MVYISKINNSEYRNENRLDVQSVQNNKWIEVSNQNQDFNNKESIFAGYVSLIKNWKTHFFKIGIRLENTNVNGYNRINKEKVEQDYIKLFPSYFYKYTKNNDESFTATYRKSIERPSFQDLNPFVIKENDYLYQIGNPALMPLYYDMIELGYSIKNHSFSIFGRHTNNTIQGVYYTDQNQINYYQPQNFGTYREAGIDYSYNNDITKWLSTNLSAGSYYNYFSSKDQMINKGFSFYNNLYAQVKVTKTFGFDVASSYYCRYPYRNVTSAQYYRMDISVRKLFFDGSLIASLKVNDLFNTERDKNTSHFKTFDFDFYQKRLTRSILISIQYTITNKKKMSNDTVKSSNDYRGRL